MNKSESDPPSGEGEEEILSSSSDSEIDFNSPEDKAHWDWLISLSENESKELEEARKACIKSYKSFPLVSLYNQTKVLLEKKYIWEVWKELKTIKESLLKGRKDLSENLDHFITLILLYSERNKILLTFPEQLL